MFHQDVTTLTDVHNLTCLTGTEIHTPILSQRIVNPARHLSDRNGAFAFVFGVWIVCSA